MLRIRTIAVRMLIRLSKFPDHDPDLNAFLVPFSSKLFLLNFFRKAGSSSKKLKNHGFLQFVLNARLQMLIEI
jgi:hypothetical protein